MLNPNWLNTFKTLIDTGHFTKTAEKLYMTQPGVSQHIRKLEESCGYPLIHREKKSFELTEQGRLVYRYALQLAQSETALLESLAFDDPNSGECRLSCSGSLALLLFPRLLERQKAHPQLTIHMEAAPNHIILAEVQNGGIDLGIVTDIPNKSMFDAEEVGREPLCLIMPNSKSCHCSSAQELIELGFIRHPNALHYASLYFSQCGNSDLANLNINDIPTSGYVNQIGQILLPVSKGLGFTVLPQSSVESFPEPEKLKLFKSESFVYETLYLVRKRNRTLPARFDNIIADIKANLL
ncbi:LysR family transcriptional regulator [Vibrio sp. JC009]|uniref:LysR family transcriptional regulator n=1 Tax=Vibrio sp. JC009 TaxID=2912314 RepID=UPI0023AFBF01|nr:LysR family transcriptional regulator [Vibrio sp. JC009]WED22900.1 LysR family transcriptional regulator [Vibrio sp. JC009]